MHLLACKLDTVVFIEGKLHMVSPSSPGQVLKSVSELSRYLMPYLMLKLLDEFE